MKKKNNKNYLDFIPVKSSKINYDINEKGNVVLEIERRSMFDKLAQNLFKSPKKSNIELDKHGSFIWNCIDNKKSVYDISKEVKKQFGRDAEPLYNRLIGFINILDNNKFITLRKVGK